MVALNGWSIAIGGLKYHAGILPIFLFCSSDFHSISSTVLVWHQPRILLIYPLSDLRSWAGSPLHDLAVARGSES